MPDNVAVTVSGIKGTSHYRLTRKSVLRIKLLILSFFIALFFLCSSVVSLVEKIKLSRHQQVLLELQSLDLNSQLNNYLSLRIRLENDISVKEEQLSLVESRLNEIETYLGSNNTELDIETRLDIAAINTAVRVAILKLIPNGAPVKGPTSSAYGMRIHPITKKRTLHKGLDFAVNTGTEIIAPADGVIEWTRKSNKGSGNFIRIIHSFGITSSYSHMKSFKVKSGQFVKKGDLIGYTGNTGITSGPHLHYEIRFVGRALDPMPFINWNIDNFETVFNNQKGIPWDFLIKAVEQQVSLALQL
ncbi:M23 family metallopeptidase [Vibrio sp. DW001]|uniref:M23 family metallopeptidase n=1 Tax=Vibrio sp. DW001 TaxID=2912315 RepID=UPI0023B07852|nr:M23 family metallopeptidase [Vibrio sp. DW001]WED28203.1 M23 family metallopeptidase [Vibrio sp. DW001]